MAEAPAGTAELSALLAALLSTDNRVRKQAEAQLKTASRHPLALLPPLAYVLQHNSDPSQRQLAAVLLRKRLATAYKELSPDVTANIKEALLKLLLNDPQWYVRRSIADVVSVVAKQAVPKNDWPELLPFLQQCFQSSSEEHREIALVVLGYLTESIGESMPHALATVRDFFLRGLQDQSRRVQIAAVKAMTGLMRCLAAARDKASVQHLLTAVLTTTRQCVADGDEDILPQVFEMIDEVIESPSSVLSSCAQQLITFAGEVALNRQFEAGNRHMAIMTIRDLGCDRPKLLTKGPEPLLQQVLPVLCHLCAEGQEKDDQGDPGDADEEDEDEEDETWVVAASTLDALAVTVPAKHIFPFTAQFAAQAIQSAKPEERMAALTVIGRVAEGCADLMKQALDPLIVLLLKGLNDPNNEVRGAAAVCTAYCADALEPNIVNHHQALLPKVFELLDDPEDSVKERACYVVDRFCDQLSENEQGDEILPYLDQFMNRLGNVLQSPKRDVQLMTIHAISSLAAASQAAFVPYVKGVLTALLGFLSLTEDKVLELRAAATECAGIVVKAVGIEAIEDVIAPLVELIFQGFTLDYSELREYSHGFFCHLAEVLGERFAPYLERVVPLAMNSANTDDGAVFDFGDEDGGGGLQSLVTQLGDDDDDDEFDMDPEDLLKGISVRTGVLDEKAAALSALGTYALKCGAQYKPYIESTVEVLDQLSTYFHEDVRIQAVLGMSHVFAATVKTFPSAVPTDPPRAEVALVLAKAVDMAKKIIETDEDSEVVGSACTCLKNVLCPGSRAALQPHLQTISDLTLLLLRGEALCQSTDYEEENEEEDDAEMGMEEKTLAEGLLDCTTEVCVGLATALGMEYQPQFDIHMGAIVERLGQKGTDASMRGVILGNLAQLASTEGQLLAGHVHSLLPHMLSTLGAEDMESRRNSAYAVSAFCASEAVVAQLTPRYGELLHALFPLFSAQEFAGVRDNAASAVCQMIRGNKSATPLEQIMPTLLGALPLQEDKAEGGAVYGCLAELLIQGEAALAPHMQRVLEIFAAALGDERIADKAKEQMAQAVGHLARNFGSQLEALLQGLPETARQRLSGAAQAALGQA
mmetsp:Transcript_7080/g.26039  ORF Transcript_7080/g.26039 Transcript_7080/m.26039 type:complete len:1099 (+) Transcript_7080:125-3421(+)